MTIKYTRELLASLAAESNSVNEMMRKLGAPMTRGAHGYLSKRLPGARIRSALAELGRPELCEDCGTGPEWRGRPMTLEVDHVNGDWSDNRPENLRLLCPNCHSITDTYCGRNKNKLKAPQGIAVFPRESKP